MSKSTWEICLWVYDKNSCSYNADCGYDFHFNEGYVHDNGFKYCPSCGGEILEDRPEADTTLDD